MPLLEYAILVLDHAAAWAANEHVLVGPEVVEPDGPRVREPGPELRDNAIGLFLIHGGVPMAWS